MALTKSTFRIAPRFFKWREWALDLPKWIGNTWALDRDSGLQKPRKPFFFFFFFFFPPALRLLAIGYNGSDYNLKFDQQVASIVVSIVPFPDTWVPVNSKGTPQISKGTPYSLYFQLQILNNLALLPHLWIAYLAFYFPFNFCILNFIFGKI